MPEKPRNIALPILETQIESVEEPIEGVKEASMLRFSSRLTLLLHSLYSISYVYPTNLHQSSILHSNRQWPALSSQSI